MFKAKLKFSEYIKKLFGVTIKYSLLTFCFFMSLNQINDLFLKCERPFRKINLKY